MGLYYSVMEWTHPQYVWGYGKDNRPEGLPSNRQGYIDDYMLPQFKDLVNTYNPSILFPDGEWENTSDELHSKEFLAWLYNESPVKDDVVVNDRWGSDCRSVHGGYFTTEYGHVGGDKENVAAGRPFEENRGMGNSFGYNRNDTIADYRSAQENVHMLVDLASRGGNYLLNVGPTADGRIPVIMQERLLEIGEWLKVNGEAIYKTRRRREVTSEDDVKFTRSKDEKIVYAICVKWPGRELKLESVKAKKGSKIVILGKEDKPLKWQQSGKELVINIPDELQTTEGRPCKYAWAIRIEIAD